MSTWGDPTTESYNIRIEVRDDGFVNWFVHYTDHEGKTQHPWDERTTLEHALNRIGEIVREHKAGAF